MKSVKKFFMGMTLTKFVNWIVLFYIYENKISINFLKNVFEKNLKIILSH